MHSREACAEGEDVNSDPDLDVLLVQMVALRADFNQLLQPGTVRQSIMLARYLYTSRLRVTDALKQRRLRTEVLVEGGMQF